MPTACCGPSRDRSTTATAPSPGGSRSAPSSGRARSTTRSRRSASARCGSSTRPSATRSDSARTSSRSWTASRATRPSTSRSSSCGRRGSSGRCRSRMRCSGGSRTARATSAPRFPRARRAEAALRHSYPDWVAETWWRELGPEAARALMAAQNEEPETAVRLVRGTIEGREDPLIPGAWIVDRVDEAALAEGRIWPQSRGSQLVGHVVGSQAGERTLDLCAAPGGKATMLAGEVVAVEVDPSRAEQLEENAHRLGATGVRVVVADGRDLPDELDGFDRALVDAPCSGLGVLASRPDLRWRADAAAGAPARAPPLRGRRARGPAGRSSTRRARSTPRSARTSSTPSSRRASSRSTEASATSGPRSGTARVPSSSRRCRMSTERAASSSPACASRPPRIASVGWGDWIRDGVEVEPSLYAADFRRLGEQIDELLAAGCRVFHFDCGDGHFVPPVTIGPVVLRSIAPGHPRRGRSAGLPPDGRRPGAPLRGVRRLGCGLGHVPRRGRGRPGRRRRARPARAGSRSASPSIPRRPRPTPPTPRTRRGRRSSSA